MSKIKKARGWSSPFAVPTSLFIRDYLQKHGEAYPFEVYRALKEKRKKLGLKTGSYINFYRYFWLLEKLELIRRTGKVEPAERGLGETSRRLFRVYFELVPENINHPAWFNPQKYYKPYVEGRKRWKQKK